MAILTITSPYYLLFLAVAIVFNIAGNSLVCIVISKKKATKNWNNWLLLQLAIADLLVAVFFTPPCILIHFIEQPAGVTGNLLCKFITGGVLGWAAASASSFLLLVIAFERYNATLHPLKNLGRGRSSWLVPMVWILAILLAIPSIAVLAYDVENEICVENFPNYAISRAYYITSGCASFLLPICIMGYLYARIILRLRDQALVPGSSTRLVSQSRNKVTKMLISVSVIFIMCYTPPVVLVLLLHVIPGGNVTFLSVATASALLNSSFNPLVYTVHSRQFRRNLASLVFCCKSK